MMTAKLIKTIRNKYEWFYLMTMLVMVLFSIHATKYLIAINLFIFVLITLLSEYRSWLLLIVLTALLSFTSAFSTELRFIIQLSSYSIVVVLVIIECFNQNSYLVKVPNEILIFITFYLLWMLLTTILSDYKSIGFSQIFRQIAFFILVYLIYQLTNSLKSVKIIISSIFLITIIYLFFIGNLFIDSGFDIVQMTIEFAYSDENFINRNTYGGFLIIATSILFPLTMQRKTEWRVYSIFFLLILWSTLIITGSRGAILSCMTGLLFSIYHLKRKWIGWIIISASVVALFVLTAPPNSLIGQYFRIESIYTGRDLILQTVSGVIKNNFWFGTGPGGTKYELYNNLPFLHGSLEEMWMRVHYDKTEIGHAHNFYLFFFSDMGVLGFLLSLMLPFIFLKRSLNLIKRLQNSNSVYYPLSIGLAATGIGFFVRGIFEWGGILSYGTIFLDLPFWLIYILIVVISENTELISKQNKVISDSD